MSISVNWNERLIGTTIYYYKDSYVNQVRTLWICEWQSNKNSSVEMDSKNNLMTYFIREQILLINNLLYHMAWILNHYFFLYVTSVSA